MTLGDFRELPFGLQLDLLLQDGSLLLCRMVGREKRALFSLNSYYVEAGWDEDDGIKFIRSFQDTEGLDSYLCEFDWRTLI